MDWAFSLSAGWQDGRVVSRALTSDRGDAFEGRAGRRAAQRGLFCRRGQRVHVNNGTMLEPPSGTKEHEKLVAKRTGPDGMIWHDDVRKAMLSVAGDPCQRATPRLRCRERCPQSSQQPCTPA